MRKKNSSKWVIGSVVILGMLGTSYWLGMNHSKLGHENPIDAVSDIFLPEEDTDEQTTTSEEEQVDSNDISRDEPKVNSEKIIEDSVKTTPQLTDPLHTISYKVHTQGRWGYKFKCPTFLNVEKTPTNNDGAVFEDGKGRKLVTYGGWNIFNETIADLYKKKPSDVRKVTYERLFANKKCYVKTGYTKDGQIFYMKEAIIGKPDEEIVVTLIFYYPKDFNQQAGKIINQIFPGFPGK